MHLLGNNFFFNIDNINNEGLLSINDLRRINDGAMMLKIQVSSQE